MELLTLGGVRRTPVRCRRVASSPRDPVSSWLAGCGLHPDEIPAPAVVLERGRHCLLPRELERFGCRLLHTPSLPTYKRWIGVPDQACSSTAPQPPAGPPDASGPAALLQAARAFVFGDSVAASAWKRPIEERLGPFPLLVVRASRLEIEAGATLVVTGTPTALAVDEVLLHAGGRITLHVPGHLEFGRLVKQEAA